MDLFKPLFGPLIAGIISGVGSYVALATELSAKLGQIETKIGFMQEQIKRLEERTATQDDRLLSYRVDNIERMIRELQDNKQPKQLMTPQRR